MRRRRVPPSRLKYEAAHPTVTVRVDRAMHEELARLKETTGLSMAQVLKVGLARAHAAAGNAYDRGYAASLEKGRSAGMQEGWDLAEAEYAVTYFCSLCSYST